MQVTTTYGSEEEKAAVDFAVYAPDGRVIRSQDRVDGTEFGMEAHGGRGPWRACFRVSSGAVLRPSVILKLTYFIVSNEDILGDNFDWQSGGDAVKINPEHLGTKEQIASLEHGLLRLDHYLMNVTQEQRYLYARTLRHLKTAESTLWRTFWYYLAIYGTICLASFSQLVIVRVMFRKVRKLTNCFQLLSGKSGIVFLLLQGRFRLSDGFNMVLLFSAEP